MKFSDLIPNEYFKFDYSDIIYKKLDKDSAFKTSKGKGIGEYRVLGRLETNINPEEKVIVIKF